VVPQPGVIAPRHQCGRVTAAISDPSTNTRSPLSNRPEKAV
jgi:hypothetical protein